MEVAHRECKSGLGLGEAPCWKQGGSDPRCTVAGMVLGSAGSSQIPRLGGLAEIRSGLQGDGGTVPGGGRWTLYGAATERRCGERRNFGRFSPGPRTGGPKKRSYWPGWATQWRVHCADSDSRRPTNYWRASSSELSPLECGTYCSESAKIQGVSSTRPYINATGRGASVIRLLAAYMLWVKGVCAPCATFTLSGVGLSLLPLSPQPSCH